MTAYLANLAERVQDAIDESRKETLVARGVAAARAAMARHTRKSRPAPRTGTVVLLDYENAAGERSVLYTAEDGRQLPRLLAIHGKSRAESGAVLIKATHLQDGVTRTYRLDRMRGFRVMGQREIPESIRSINEDLVAEMDAAFRKLGIG